MAQVFLVIALMLHLESKSFRISIALAWISTSIAWSAEFFQKEEIEVCLFSSAGYVNKCSQPSNTILGLPFKTWALIGMSLLVLLTYLERYRVSRKNKANHP